MLMSSPHPTPLRREYAQGSHGIVAHMFETRICNLFLDGVCVDSFVVSMVLMIVIMHSLAK